MFVQSQTLQLITAKMFCSIGLESHQINWDQKESFPRTGEMLDLAGIHKHTYELLKIAILMWVPYYKTDPLRIILQQWKGINHKQSTRWQHLSRLKASAFFSLQIFFSCCETQQRILGTGTAIWWVTQPHLDWLQDVRPDETFSTLIKAILPSPLKALALPPSFN
jgi:hypothetical protein